MLNKFIFNSIVLGFFLLGAAGFALVYANHQNSESGLSGVEASPMPALSVAITSPETQDIPLTLAANGSIAPWHEAIIGCELNGLRLIEVSAQVGDQVKKGQVLAQLANDSVLADIAQAKAVLAEAKVNLADAQLNVQRSQRLASGGAISEQQIVQFVSNEQIALAKTELAQAQLANQLIRLEHTKIIASDNGSISSRSAALGEVVSQGQEMFRLIRQNRLEWRAEVTAEELVQLKPGMPVRVAIANIAEVTGVIRSMAPKLDNDSRNALVYVDLPAAAQLGIRAGMYARGEFQLGSGKALTIPQEALSIRDGFGYAFKVNTPEDAMSSVTQLKLQTGRRINEKIEIISGMQADDYLVAGGVAFLADGNQVKIIRK